MIYLYWGFSYYFILEIIQGYKRSKRFVNTLPCGETVAVLLELDYHTAHKKGSSCYVAAKLQNMNHESFTIGDGKTYGRYFNAPLVHGQIYDLWMAATSYMDGVSINIKYTYMDERNILPLHIFTVKF